MCIALNVGTVSGANAGEDSGAFSTPQKINVAAAGAAAKVPPRSGAAMTPNATRPSAGTALRDANVRDVWKLGRERWKVESGYHQRSMAENAMYRVKTIFGGSLSSREIRRQKTEAAVKMRALNKMTQLGMPESVKKSW